VLAEIAGGGDGRLTEVHGLASGDGRGGCRESEGQEDEDAHDSLHAELQFLT
jgi:hypothetical protein